MKRDEIIKSMGLDPEGFEWFIVEEDGFSKSDMPVYKGDLCVISEREVNPAVMTNFLSNGVPTGIKSSFSFFEKYKGKIRYYFLGNRDRLCSCC